MESDSSQTDGTLTPGIRYEIPVGGKLMPLPLPWMNGVIPHTEWPALKLQQAALGGLDQDPGEVFQTLP